MTAKTRLVDAVKAQVDPVTGVIEFSSGSTSFPLPSISGRSFALLGDSRTSQNLRGPGTPSSIVRSGGTVTLTLTAHGIKTGQKIKLFNVTDAGGTADFYINNVAVTRTGADTITWPDSRPDATASWGTKTLPGSGGSAPSGFHVTSWYNTYCWWEYLNGFFGGGLKLSGNWGISSARATDLAPQITEVIASTASDVIVDVGINDCLSGGASTPAVIASSIQSVCAQLRNAGKVVWLSSIDPLASSYSTPIPKNARVSEVNRLNKAWCQDNPGVIYLDSYAGLVDPMSATAGSGVTNYYQTDYIHFSAGGARQKARKFYATMSSRIPVPDPKITSNGDTYNSDTQSLNVMDAILFTNAAGGNSTGSTGTVSGLTVATGLGMVVTGATATCTGAPTSARSDGYGYDQTFVFTPAAANDSLVITAQVTSPGTRIALGDMLRAFAELTLTGVSGSNLKGVYASIGAYDGSSTERAWSGNAENSAALFGTDDQTYTINFADIPATGNTQVYLQITLIFGAAGTALTGKLGRISLLKNAS